MRTYFLSILLVLLQLTACQIAPPPPASTQLEEVVSAILPASNFQKLLKNSPNAQLIDVRTPAEFASGYLPNAVNIDFQTPNFEENIKKLDKDKTVFVYCASGGRSGKTSKILAGLNFKEVYDLKGGIRAWKKAGLPVGE